MRKVKWGILGAAKIARQRVIPGMQKSDLCEVTAIASRDLAKGQAAASELGVPKAYGSYEEMLADPEIEAIYNPLPNHLHVPWSIRAAEAGKHVLCEKPIGMNAAEVRQLMAVRDRTGVVIGEAFMVQTHPQWARIVELVRSGRIGQLRSAIGAFGYFNTDPANVRNILAYGGGGLMDIGCYPIKTARMVFGEEPLRVASTMVRDAALTGVDVLTSAILEFPSGTCVFTCSMQLAAHQSMRFYGTKGFIAPEIPFNATPGGTSRITIDDGRDLSGGGRVVEEFAACDHYTLQGDRFSRAVREGGAPPVPLEDSIRNMAVIDAIVRAEESGGWVSPAEFLKDL
jgi:predicted dehydrogenase